MFEFKSPLLWYMRRYSRFEVVHIIHETIPKVPHGYTITYLDRDSITEVCALFLLISQARMRILLSLPSNNTAPVSVTTLCFSNRDRLQCIYGTTVYEGKGFQVNNLQQESLLDYQKKKSLLDSGTISNDGWCLNLNLYSKT